MNNKTRKVIIITLVALCLNTLFPPRTSSKYRNIDRGFLLYKVNETHTSNDSNGNKRYSKCEINTDDLITQNMFILFLGLTLTVLAIKPKEDTN